jgi:hypothetical protein
VIFTLGASEPANNNSCGGLSKWLDTPVMVVSNMVMSLCVRGSERLDQLNNCQLLIEDLQHEAG